MKLIAPLVVMLTLGLFAVAMIYLVAGRHAVRHMLRWGEGPLKLARCQRCNEKITGCDHVGGVPSTWEHLKTGDHFCADGREVAHK
jgi:hypothetical protein